MVGIAGNRRSSGFEAIAPVALDHHTRLAVTALIIAAVYFVPSPPRAPLITFTVLPEEKTTLTGQVAVVLPDGRRIAFVARNAEGNSWLWLRTLDSAETRRLPGTEGAYFPAWSPAGRWIVFSDPYKLKKIDIETGQILSVADAGRMVRGLAWAPDGSLFFGTQGGPIRRVSAAGGIPERQTVLDRSAGSSSTSTRCCCRVENACCSSSTPLKRRRMASGRLRSPSLPIVSGFWRTFPLLAMPVGTSCLFAPALSWRSTLIPNAPNSAGRLRRWRPRLATPDPETSLLASLRTVCWPGPRYIRRFPRRV